MRKAFHHRIRTLALCVALAGGTLAGAYGSPLGQVLGMQGTAAPFSFSLEALIGTHRIGAGGSVAWERKTPIDTGLVAALCTVFPRAVIPALGESVALELWAGYMLYDKYFGLPGPSRVLKGGSRASYFLGSGPAEQGLDFALLWYLATDGTSQLSGELGYSLRFGGRLLKIDYENDTIVLCLEDRFRTGAFRIAYLDRSGGIEKGLACGFNFWAGERDGYGLAAIWNGGNPSWPDEMHRGRTAALGYGGEYAVDVVYASVLFGAWSLSVGCDSEIFKAGIHNSIHWLLDDANLPHIDHPDRLFIELRLNDSHSLF